MIPTMLKMVTVINNSRLILTLLKETTHFSKERLFTEIHRAGLAKLDRCISEEVAL
jgi:hypothetical protein